MFMPTAFVMKAIIILPNFLCQRTLAFQSCDLDLCHKFTKRNNVVKLSCIFQSGELVNVVVFYAK